MNIYNLRYCAGNKNVVKHTNRWDRDQTIIQVLVCYSQLIDWHTV